MTQPFKPISACILTTILFSASSTLAAPAAEPRCVRQINHPPNTKGVLFNDTCQIAYVQPPDNGQARASAMSINTNIGFCPSVLKISGVVEKTLDSAGIIADKITKMIKDFEPLDANLQKIADDMAKAQAELTAATATLEADNQRKTELVTDVGLANNAYETCILIKTAAECADAKAASDAAKNELKDFVVNTLSPDQKAQIAARAKFDSLASQYSSRTKQYTEATAPLFALQKDLDALRESVMSSYDKYGRMIGIVAQLTYSIPWESLMSGYRAANPGVTFEPLPIVSSNFHAAVNPVLMGAGGNIPVVLGFSVPGAKSQGAQAFPTGESSVPAGSSSVESPDVGQVTMPFGSSVSGQIIFSLVGSCVHYPTGIASAPTGDTSNLLANMVGNIVYEYEVKAHRGYTARYNLSQFVSRLESMKKKGGLFSSSTLREVYESASSSDWFDIQFDQTALGFSYTSDEKENIKREARGQLMERAMRLIAVQNGSLPGAGPRPSLTPTGAGVAAGYLMSGCGFWSWCTVGGWVLGVADSIFGSQSAVSNFKRNNSVWVTDKVVDAVILKRYGGLTFVKN